MDRDNYLILSFLLNHLAHMHLSSRGISMKVISCVKGLKRNCLSVPALRNYRNCLNLHRGQFYSESTASRIHTCNKMTPIIVTYIGTT